MKNDFTYKRKRSLRSKAHPRTQKTYQNKINKLRAFYRKHPRIQKKYSTFEAWLRVVKVKEVGKQRESSYTSPIIPKTERKKTAWGM